MIINHQCFLLCFSKSSSSSSTKIFFSSSSISINQMHHIKIADALKEQAKNIAILREQCKESIEKDPEQFNDDLFLLRFCLSHKDSIETKAVAALKETCEWRIQNKDRLAVLASGKMGDSEKKLIKYSPWQLHGFSKEGDPIVCILSGWSNNAACLENMTEQEIKDGIIFQKEYVFTLCDRESRKRGHICKLINLVDFKGFSLWNLSREFSRIMGEAMKVTENLYPQLLGMMFFFNTPLFMSAVMSMAEFFLPKKTFAKISRCGASSTRKESISTCPFAKHFLHPNELPPMFGGSCDKCNARCIAGQPNDLHEMVATETAPKTTAELEEEASKKNHNQDKDKDGDEVKKEMN